ncbi:Uncharacterised protein [Legionella spiritensis]|nr:Uncharacterised protein [Legionella spiritensis]
MGRETVANITKLKIQRYIVLQLCLMPFFALYKLNYLLSGSVQDFFLLGGN